MAKNKVNKQKAKLSPETKDKLKTGFGTLVSNDACIKAGREYPWYTPIILAVCSVIVTLIPSFVSNMSVNMGTSILGTSSVGGIENGLADFQSTIKSANASVKISDDGKLVVTDETKKSIYGTDADGKTNEYYEYRDSVTDEPVLRVQFSEDNISTDYLNSLSKYTVTSSTTVTDNSGSTTEVADTSSKSYRVSILVFKQTGFSMAVYNRRIDASGSSALVNYSYDRLAGKDLLSLTPSISKEEKPSEYVSSVVKNYQDLLTAGYESTKISLTWRNTGILTGINAGVILLLGLVLFLVTRGKRNPYRIITIWQCQKIAYWAAPAPAILSMALGFMLSNVSTMSSLTMFMFLFLYGLRIMWTSMKAFSPQGN